MIENLLAELDKVCETWSAPNIQAHRRLMKVVSDARIARADVRQDVVQLPKAEIAAMIDDAMWRIEHKQYDEAIVSLKEGMRQLSAV